MWPYHQQAHQLSSLFFYLFKKSFEHLMILIFRPSGSRWPDLGFIPLKNCVVLHYCSTSEKDQILEHPNFLRNRFALSSLAVSKLILRETGQATLLDRSWANKTSVVNGPRNSCPCSPPTEQAHPRGDQGERFVQHSHFLLHPSQAPVLTGIFCAVHLAPNTSTPNLTLYL